jgi:opacity protein-like surface antigen
MRSSGLLLPAVCLIAWSGAALAVTQKTDITITDKNGTPVKNQEVTFTVHEPAPKAQTGQKTEKPRQISQITKKTDDHGKVVLTYDDEDLKRGAQADISVPTDRGTERLTDLSLAEIIKNGGVRLEQFTATETAPSTPRRGERRVSGTHAARGTSTTAAHARENAGFQPAAGLEFAIGGDLAWATTWNNYDGFPGFASHGFGGGGHVGLRYNLTQNIFAGFELGGVGTDIHGNNPDGAFVRYRWQLWELGQIGVTWTPPMMTTPVTIYGAGGFAQGGVTFGVESDFVHESMSKTLGGYMLRAGGDVYVMPNLSVGASYSFSQFRTTVNGDPLKTQINMFLVSGTYHLPIQ